MSSRADVDAALVAAMSASTLAQVAATEAQAAAETATAAVLAAADAFAAYQPDAPPPEPETPTEPEPEPPATSMRFGIYPGATVKETPETAGWETRVEAFERRTGIDVVQVGGNQDQRTEGARGSVRSIAESKVPVPTVAVAIQLAFTGDPYPDTHGKKPRAVKRAALEATIAGRNDGIYVANAAALKASRYERIILRLGSEGDIPFPPHSFLPGSDGGKGNDDAYREAWVHVRKIFDEALGDRAWFSYTTTMRAASVQMACADGKTRSALEAGYPGDLLTDIVGIDCYLGQPLKTVKAYVAGALAFAKAKGKPAAFDEWGINADGVKLSLSEQCDYVRWVASLPLEYASFFAGWTVVTWPDDYPAGTRDCLIGAFT